MPGTGVNTREAYCGNFFNPFSGIASDSFTCGEKDWKGEFNLGDSSILTM